MATQEQLNYTRIAEAIQFIKENFQQQPSLDEIAATVHLSPYHFQRLFTGWAGVSPKKFLQYISVEYAKGILKQGKVSISDAAYETGLSGTSRLHDLFLTIEGMTPGEYKNGGESLSIHYSYAESPFGNIIVASTTRGICHLAFFTEEKEALSELQRKFPYAQYRQMVDLMQQNALQLFRRDWTALTKIKLHLKGTEFQLKVWEALLKIPVGSLATYGKVAKAIQLPGAFRAVGTAIQLPGAFRAVGTAIGSNPVAFLIPCHRVIQSGGLFGGYRWGTVRKTAMIGWEAAQLHEGESETTGMVFHDALAEEIG